MGQKRDWLICFGGSHFDGVQVYSYAGTVDEVKALLVDEVQKLINYEECDEAEYFTESVDEVQEHDCVGAWGSYYAYVSFNNYHVDIEAIPMDDITPYGVRW